MSYISLNYYLMVTAALVLYYVFPIKWRWTVLLTGNIVFYYCFYKTGWWIFLGTIVISYFVSILMSKFQGKKKGGLLAVGILGVTIPWFLIKNGNFILVSILRRDSVHWIVPLGISFYTLQMIAYMMDIFHGKVLPQRNLAKFILFVSFFPQLIQGPISRYSQLQKQLVEGHRFDEEKFVKGFCYIIWGFFLKLVIADKAAVIVNTVFDNYPRYSGFYIWVASFLYSIQLYADFLACTTLAQGVSKLFGIEIIDNFARPYFATSIKDFWRRWHISLSSWLKDYIYISLGGNRCGKLRKNINLVITFFVSGIWHGAGYKFIFWGLMHAVYEILGNLTEKYRECLYEKLHVSKMSRKKRILKQMSTFLLVNWAWIIFRADTLTIGLKMIMHMIIDFNPWVLFNDRLFTLGLGWKEVIILLLAILILWRVSCYHEKGFSVSEKLMAQRLPIRWGIYMSAIIVILVFGTYGFGFNAQDFIYGGF